MEPSLENLGAGFQFSSLNNSWTQCVLLLQSSDYKRHKHRHSAFAVQTCTTRHANPSPCHNIHPLLFKSSSLASRCIRFLSRALILPWIPDGTLTVSFSATDTVWSDSDELSLSLFFLDMRCYIVRSCICIRLYPYTQNCCASCKAHLVHTGKTTTEPTFTSAVVYHY